MREGSEPATAVKRKDCQCSNTWREGEMGDGERGEREMGDGGWWEGEGEEGGEIDGRGRLRWKEREMEEKSETGERSRKERN